MAGLYVHIPFCRQICYYCDFYKIGNLKLIESFTNSLIKEIEEKCNFTKETITTIYFGGGTPSLLTSKAIQLILEKLYSSFNFVEGLEQTIEINPDDVNKEYLLDLKELGFNRLSIGIQSFNNDILKFLNRSHNSSAAVQVLNDSISVGFDNISLDLIYGIPGQSIGNFDDDLKLVKQFNISHISAYHLGIEEGTLFGKQKKHGKINDIDEKLSLKFFETLTNWAKNMYYEHYEVSNFARDKKYSQHNMNYWFKVPYLGIGPSAHSYDGLNRFYNIANLNKYIRCLADNSDYNTIDELSLRDTFNEFVMLKLRTIWGINLNELKTNFPTEYTNELLKRVSKFILPGYVVNKEGFLKLSKTGFFMSDYIVRELFLLEDM